MFRLYPKYIAGNRGFSDQSHHAVALRDEIWLTFKFCFFADSVLLRVRVQNKDAVALTDKIRLIFRIVSLYFSTDGVGQRVQGPGKEAVALIDRM